jgi:CubicO group peptidase (beta-lactamase class C family)
MHRRRMSTWLVLLLIAASAAFAQSRPGAQPAAEAGTQPVELPSFRGFDEFVAGAMKDWKGPGVAVVAIKDDQVVLLKGYGYRDLEKHLPVTPNTLFPIASITKSFTVTTLGMLVDEGKLQWDTPIREYLPDFRMYDPVATEEMTARDLVTHRSGLPRHDRVADTSNFTREDLVHRLRYLQPSKPFRSTFQYSNLMFMTAGYLAGKRNGTTWEEAVRQHVLIPLGMSDTNFSIEESQKTQDAARPYRKDQDTMELKLTEFHDLTSTGPAGSINSNVSDMGRYLIFHMNHGKFGGKQLLSQNNSIQMQTPQMVIQDVPQYPEVGTRSYGMGFSLFTYRGHRTVEHGGNIDGFSDVLAFLPDDHVGVVVLTNIDQSFLQNIIAYNVLDRLLDLQPLPWNARLLELDRHFEASRKEAKGKGYTRGRPGTHPSHDLDDYVGDYENPGYGMVSISRDGDSFQVKINEKIRPLRHFHYDVFQVPERPTDDFANNLKVAFHANMNGDIASLSIPLEPAVDDIVFTRLPDKNLTDHSFLAKLTGKFDMPGRVEPLTISLRGDHTLVASLPGQPDTELIPTRGTTFEISGHPGFTIEFKRDANGQVVEAAYDRVDTVLVLKKRVP